MAQTLPSIFTNLPSAAKASSAFFANREPQPSLQEITQVLKQELLEASTALLQPRRQTLTAIMDAVRSERKS